jgi:hypothetical protein
MGNLTSSSSFEPSPIKGVIKNKKLYDFFINTFNDKYYIGNYKTKVLLKRAICTGQTRIPISFPFVNENNEIKEYTINIDIKDNNGNLLKKEEEKLGNDAFNIYMNQYGQKCNSETDQTCENYSSEFSENMRITQSQACRTFYTGNINGDSVDPNSNTTDFNSFCGTVLNIRRLNGEDYNGNKNNFNENGQGNSYFTNEFRDCNCVNSASTKNYQDFKIVNSAQTLNQYMLTQNFDRRCNNYLDSTFNPANYFIKDLCINRETIGGNVKISEHSEYNSKQSCSAGTPQIVEKHSQPENIPTQPEPTQPEPTQPEPTQPEPTQPEPISSSDLNKITQKHTIIVTSVFSVVVSILLFIIFKELL